MDPDRFGDVMRMMGMQPENMKGVIYFGMPCLAWLPSLA